MPTSTTNHNPCRLHLLLTTLLLTLRGKPEVAYAANVCSTCTGGSRAAIPMLAISGSKRQQSCTTASASSRDGSSYQFPTVSNYQNAEINNPSRGVRYVPARQLHRTGNLNRKYTGRKGKVQKLL
jgi:hypothetical protein